MNKQYARALASVFAVVALVIGVPVGLSTLVGWPLPTTMPSFDGMWTALRASDVPDMVIVNALALVVWLAWVQVVIAFSVEITSVVRGRMAQHVRGFGAAQALASFLVAGVLLVSHPQRNGFTPQPLALVLAVDSVAAHTADAGGSTAAAASPAAPTYDTYTVQRRDNLWQIAADQLGDAKRWPEIFELNQGKTQSDGRSLKRPEMIHPGWVLQLPTATAPAAAPAVVGSTKATTTSTEESSKPLSNDQTVMSTEAVPPVAESSTDSVGGNETAVESSDDHSHVVLASGSVVGLGFASAVSIALMTLRNRRRRSQTPHPPLADIVLRDESIDEDLRAMRRAALHAEPSVDVQPNPGIVAVGKSEGIDVDIDLTKTGIIHMGAESIDEARAFVLTHLLSGPAIDAEVRIVGAALATELMGESEMFSGLTVDRDIDALLTLLESEVVVVARTFDLVGVETLEELRDESPSDRMPVTLVVVREPTKEQLRRLEAVVEQGKRYGITALVIGEAVAGMSLPDVDLRYRLTKAEAAKVTDVVANTRSWNQEIVAAEGESALFEIPETTDDGMQPLVRIRLLGSPAIIVNGEEVQQQVRGKSLELAAFLAVRPSGAMSEVVGAALWPEANGKQVGERFATVSSDLRRVLRKVTGINDRKFVERTHAGYRLDSEVVSCDVWDFEAALSDVSSSAGDTQRSIAALEKVVSVYEAHFCDEAPYEWADDVREHFRRRALDAYTLLSEVYEERGERMRGLAVLERAMTLDPYREDVYQRVMRIQCETEQFAPAQRTGELIVSRLSSLNLEPSARTTELLTAARRATKRPLAG